MMTAQGIFLFVVSVHDPVGVIAEFKGNEFYQGGQDRLLPVASRSSVADQDVEIATAKVSAFLKYRSCMRF